MKKLTFTVWVKLLAKCSKIFVEKLSMFKHDNSEADIIDKIELIDSIIVRMINENVPGERPSCYDILSDVDNWKP